MSTVSSEPRLPRTRRLILAAVAVVVVVVVVIVVLLTRGGAPPPATGAASLVPADALVYVHLSIDPRRPEVRSAQGLARRFPDYPVLARALTARLDSMLGGGVALDYSRQVRPWLGREAAFAVLNTPGASAGSLIVLDLRRAGKLFVTGAVRAGAYRGIALYRTSAGTDLAFVGHYLLAGQDASVRAAIDVGIGERRSLAADPAYLAAAAGEPPGRVLDAYVSSAGVSRVLAPRGGVIGALAILLSRPGLRGATVAVSPAAHGATVRVHSALTSDITRAPSPTFTPTLAQRITAGVPFMLGVADLTRAAPTVLSASAQLGLVSGLGPLLSRLGAALTSEGINVASAASIFAHESAVLVTSGGGAPGLAVVARTSSPTAARGTLARLESPLVQIFTPTGSAAGQVPEWGDRQVGAVTARQFAFAPGLQLDYAVIGDQVVVSTNLAGIAAVAHGRHSLADAPAFKRVSANHPSRVTSLLFLDFSQLLSLGEQTGLVRSSLVRRLDPDLGRIRAVGASSTGGETDTTAELFLEIP